MAEAENFTIRYDEVPIDALNFSLRLRLSTMLNPELPFFERDRYARDFRGMAELMGFGHIDIMNFQRHPNPTMEILNAWGRNHKVSELLQILETMERHDVINDLMPAIIENVRLYLSSRNVQLQPLQDSEVTSCIDNLFPPDNPDRLTIHDTDQLATFHAYVCYANSDIQFVRWLANKLETPSTGIRLCIKDRDLPFGTLEYDTFVRLIQERCHRILIVLSPEFLVTPECDFQARYAASLASEHRGRRLIPIVYKPCEIPAILKYISKVDFSRTDIQDWIWDKLVASIKMPTSRMFVPSSNFNGDSQATFESVPVSDDNNNSFQMAALPSVPSSESSLDLPSAISSIENPYASAMNGERDALVESSVGNRSRGPRFVQRIRNFMASSTSSGSSGFHSQSDA